MSKARERAGWKVWIFALFLMLILVAMDLPALADLSFDAAKNYGAGNSPFFVTTGDFNADGKLDLSVANFYGSNVSILLGNGDGTFQAAMNHGVGASPASVTSGDFNNDGKLDLGVANQYSDNVSILLGNGDGTFQAAVNHGAGSRPCSVTTGDFNRDGKMDLAAANVDGVSVLLGNGDGTFQTAVDYGAGQAPSSVASGDFNRDGKLDLAVTNSDDGNVSILLGNGNGTFQAAVNYGVGAVPYSVTSGDFDADGKLDLAVVNWSSSNLSILLGNGDGTFRAAVHYGAGTGPYAVITGDFNGDGKLDVAVVNAYGNNVSILLGNGDGTLQPRVNYAGGNESYSITAGDFNDDGRPDLAVANFASNNVSILLNSSDFDPADGFRPPVHYDSGSDPNSLTTGDFDRDGKVDFAVANVSENTVSILLGNGDGTFQTPVAYEAGNSPSSVVTGDFNRDGRLDLAVANYYENTVSILLGNGNGTFQPAVHCAVGSYPLFVVAGDFDDDGKLDVAVANTFGFSVSVLLGNGDGTCQPAVNYGTGGGPYGPYSLAVSDFDGDGKLDLAVANDIGNNVTILLGNGDGTFQTAVNYEVGSAPRSVTPADLNADGKLDLAVASYGSETVSILLGNGDGAFQTAVGNGAGKGPLFVTANDFNRDGKLDLAVANYDSNDVSILLGNGDGTFQRAVNFGAGDGSGSIVTGDFNRDGRLDLAVKNWTSHNISILINTTIYSITVTTGSNGDISPSGEVPVFSGDDQSFTITPNACYHVVDVLVDGSSVGAVTRYAFNDVTADHTISATFAFNGNITITAMAGTNGSVSPSGQVAVTCGSDQSFTITPDTGYHVDDVLVDGSSVGAVTRYPFNNATTDHTLSASFMVTSSATTPRGTTDGRTGYFYTYSTSDSPGGGDPVEFQFDWKGDGSDLSPWGSSTQTKSWPSAGTYMVRARARCARHPSIISDWSAGLQVVVVGPNLIDFKINDGAPHTLSPSVTLTYATTGNPRYIRTSTGPSWTSWQDLSTLTLPHTLSLGTANGIREVFAQVKDDQGGISPVARASIILDTKAPKGVVKINGGKRAVADGGPGGTAVRLHLAMFDVNMAGAQMRVKKDKPFASPDDEDLWEAFATGKDLILTAGTGARKVFVQFKDGAGKDSKVYSQSIKVLAAGGIAWPGVSAVTVNNLELTGGTGTTYSTNPKVTLSYSLPDYSGLSVRYLWTTALGTVWSSWKPVAGNSITKSLMLSTTNGSRQVYMQLREDTSGRITDPLEAAIILDTKKPAGVVRINNGIPWIPQNTSTVTLTILAKDLGSGIDKMAIYQTGEVLPNPIGPDDPRFEDFVPDVAGYALDTSTLGTKTIYVWIKDKAGKISALMKDSIDVIPP